MTLQMEVRHIFSDLIGHSPPSRGWLCPGHERHPGPVPSGDRLGGCRGVARLLRQGFLQKNQRRDSAAEFL